MKIALFIVVCEGEYEIACDSLDRLLDVCPQHAFDLYIVDDGSPSDVGRRLMATRTHRFGRCELVKLPKSIGFWGTCTRMMIGFRKILEAGCDYDFVLEIDADLFPVRVDLGSELERVCSDKGALYGCLFDLRKRDSMLVLADLFPVGFSRRAMNGVLNRQWSLRRWRRTWWDDLGMRALRNGYRFRSIGGAFWMLGFDALKRMERTGVLARDDSRLGLHVADDSLLTILCHGLDIPVVDFGRLSPAWQGVLSFGPDVPWDVVQQVRPYVVHPLKNTGPGWQRRKDLVEKLSAPAINTPTT